MPGPRLAGPSPADADIGECFVRTITATPFFREQDDFAVQDAQHAFRSGKGAILMPGTLLRIEGHRPSPPPDSSGFEPSGIFDTSRVYVTQGIASQCRADSPDEGYKTNQDPAIL
jgi:hypothetical protein